MFLMLTLIICGDISLTETFRLLPENCFLASATSPQLQEALAFPDMHICKLTRDICSLASAN